MTTNTEKSILERIVPAAQRAREAVADLCPDDRATALHVALDLEQGEARYQNAQLRSRMESTMNALIGGFVGDQKPVAQTKFTQFSGSQLTPEELKEILGEESPNADEKIQP